MKLLPYKEILKYSKEKIQESLAPIRAMQAKKQAELEIAKLEEKIATQESEITEITSKHPLNFEKLLDALDELALTERRKEQFESIINDLFEESTEASK
jgi:uncharacterized coiled-coil protein SlyX